jgi:hypothetical protein
MTEAIRTSVPLTDEERATIKAAMRREGIRGMGNFLRVAALKWAREGDKQ